MVDGGVIASSGPCVETRAERFDRYLHRFRPALCWNVLGLRTAPSTRMPKIVEWLAGCAGHGGSVCKVPAGSGWLA